MFSFNGAVSGLKVAEQNLYVTSNNLSNVETEGYHRQRLNQYTFRPVDRARLTVGLGVDADSVRQTRLEFLESNYRNELSPLGEFRYKDKIYTSLQSIIGSDGSYLQDTLRDMWESFSELSKEYTTTVAGSYLRENSLSLIAEFNGINEQLDKMQSELDIEVINTVRKINDYASQIADLNERIVIEEGDGSVSCRLRDSRDAVIASLSELVNIEVENGSEACVNIRTTSGHLVVNTVANRVSTAQIIPNSIYRFPIWEGSGLPFEVTSGELKGILDMRGGNVVGNLEHSSNGAPKERMDIAVSIDTDMDFATIQGMAKNLKSMIDTFDRQSVNYQLYLADGKKVSGEELSVFAEYLYKEAANLEIDGYTGTSMSEFLEHIEETYGNDSKFSEDMWEYVGSKGLDLAGFKTYLEGEGLDAQDMFNRYRENGGTTLAGFARYLNNLPASNEATEIQEHMREYTDILLDKNDIKNYINNKYNQVPTTDVSMANSNNVLQRLSEVTIINFRDDSNKYMMVFTDKNISDVTKDETGAILNEADISLIAVTKDGQNENWIKLAETTSGNVFDILSLGNDDGGEDLGLSLTREFNSRLLGADEETGIAHFRSGLNSLLNGLAREINGIMRQGKNRYGNMHGDIVKDEFGNVVIDIETGEPKKYNLDLFLKIREDYPLQMGNIKLNPLFSDSLNMPLTLTGADGDFQIGNMLVDLISKDVFNNKDSYSTFDEHYANFILDFAQQANIALTGYETQTEVVSIAKDRISQVSGVSMDEELSNMVKYQYSYTAASKMIRVIDEMLETVIAMK